MSGAEGVQLCCYVAGLRAAMAADSISLDPVKWAENRLTDAEWEQWDRDGVRFAHSVSPSLLV